MKAIKIGNFAEVAAAAAGVASSTYYMWMQKGEIDGRSPYREFSEAIREAEAYAEVRAVRVIARAMPSEPRHAEWYLERKHPARWGKREKHELTGKDGGPIELQTSDITEAALDQRIAEAQARLAGRAKGHPGNQG